MSNTMMIHSTFTDPKDHLFYLAGRPEGKPVVGNTEKSFISKHRTNSISNYVWAMFRGAIIGTPITAATFYAKSFASTHFLEHEGSDFCKMCMDSLRHLYEEGMNENLNSADGYDSDIYEKCLSNESNTISECIDNIIEMDFDKMVFNNPLFFAGSAVLLSGLFAYRKFKDYYSDETKAGDALAEDIKEKYNAMTARLKTMAFTGDKDAQALASDILANEEKTNKELLNVVLRGFTTAKIEEITKPLFDAARTLKISPPTDLSLLDTAALQLPIIEQQPKTPVSEQNVAQISSQATEMKTSQKIKVKDEQNTTLNTLTAKVQLACLAVYISTWFTDFAVKNGAMYVPKLLEGEYWRIGTVALIHTDALHFLNNMEALNSDGPKVEKRWGALGFAKLAACALVANTATEILFGDYSVRSIGFSGVGFALAGANHLIKSVTGVKIDPNWWKFWSRQIGYALLMDHMGKNSINHKAHVSGYLAGMAFSYLSK